MGILTISNLTKHFGGLKAIQSLSFDVEKDSIHALIGPNGAGKTTVLNCISGFYKASGGRIIVNGKNIQNFKDYNVFKAGIARTFQNLEIFGDLTVFENVMTARFRFMKAGVVENMLRLPRAKREERDNHRRVEKILRLVGLETVADQKSGGLPYGQQKLVELARAMALEPKILLLDEPAAGYNSEEVSQLSQTLIKVRDLLEATILLVEHNMALIMAISDWITVMHHGQYLAEGRPHEIESNAEVIEAYLGKGYQPMIKEETQSA
jgi:ABC-type branched-subunit amino acid transport system ATPase component